LPLSCVPDKGADLLSQRAALHCHAGGAPELRGYEETAGFIRNWWGLDRNPDRRR